MPTYKYTVDGEPVPSVTGVIAFLGDNKRALIHSAWKLGSEGKNYREEWGSAAKAGTMAHALCEAHMLSKPLPSLDHMSEEEKAGALDRFESFKTWLRQHDYKPVAAEVPIVHDQLRYGGTIDCIGIIDGKPALIDLKSKTLYKDQILQVGAYRLLWDSAHKDLAIASVHILGMSEGFHHHMISEKNVNLGTSAFLSLLDVYRAVKAIKV